MHHTRSRRHERPQVRRFGTFREMTREGFTGNLDGGLILGPNGTTTPGADPGAT